LALVIPQTKSVTLKYIPVLEREEDCPAVFELRRIRQRDFAKIEDKLARVYEDQSIGLSTASFNYNIVKVGLVGWEGINDEFGRPITPVKTKEGLFTDEYIDMIPSHIVTELAEVIAAITRDPDSYETFYSIGSPEAVDAARKAGEEEAKPAKTKSAKPKAQPAKEE
jgi:hypothetical protein